ncbi:uncharacterized protein si:dkey-74k8.3 [Trichomycterus rosablanca]|uniref:uncharacterized protein si:dkey-74k8.3 n=1 Tax=Trichomycterus rosablanca TaxID=2290929 RepID=UPI002F35AD63
MTPAPRFLFLVLAVLPALCSGKDPENGSRLAELVGTGRQCVESVLGSQTIELCCTVWNMALQFVAEGAAAGLNVIAVYVAEILRATGLADPIYIPRFTPQGMTQVAQWGLLAVIGYWLLYAALRVGVAFVRRTFWMLKVVALLWIFVRIISDHGASDETTAVRLCWLVALSAAWSVATRGRSAGDASHVEKRLVNLEERVAAMERRRAE